MKTLIIALCSLMSASLYAKPVTVPLTTEEIELAIHLSDKYEVPLQVKGPCSQTEFKILTSVKGFNPAVWSLEAQKTNAFLTGEEIQSAIDLFNRLEIPGKQVDSITRKSEVTIKAASCGFTPNSWTARFDNLK